MGTPLAAVLVNAKNNKELKMELSYEDVLEILELLENSKVEYLELEIGGTKLVADKSGISHYGPRDPQVVTEPARIPPAAHGGAASAPVAAVPPTSAPAADEALEEGLVYVTAPVVGVFYRQSEPGAPPYVEIGSKVEEGTTLGLLEVMKMFTSVTAHVAGEIVEILVENNEFVEFEQRLMVIRPGTAA